MTTMETSRQNVLNLQVGELVEVSSESEILATLDEKGEVEALPFMPEMRQFCGQRLRVHKRAAKETAGAGGPRLRALLGPHRRHEEAEDAERGWRAEDDDHG